MSIPEVDYKVSVILTVYNRESYLKRSIDSLLRQSLKEWELIAIDDGSEDNSFQILTENYSKYSNIKIMQQENIKLPLSRNKGIKNATGKYITFLDSDDEYEKDHLLIRYQFLEKYPEIDLIHGGVNIIGDEYVRDKNNPQKLIHLSQCTVGATFFGKRKVFLNLNGFRNIDYSEDSEFLERAEKYFKVEKVNFNTYKYHRDAPNSITNTYAPEF
ncbi:MAG: glycosyltransferase family 2 protein [Bacteroidetes bacterium]|nr:glycosyltransferase family 2 protein [Bacteroidota bacterium]